MVLKKIKMNFICLFILGLISQSCGIYTFTGAATSAKSISIQNFTNESGMGPSQLSQQFTEQLRLYYQQNTRMAIVKDDGALMLSGSIISYSISPIAPTSANIAAQNRLTITVKVNFIHSEDDSQSFREQTFAQFFDFDQSKSLTSIESEAIKTINDKLTFDIFNKTVANW